MANIAVVALYGGNLQKAEENLSVSTAVLFKAKYKLGKNHKIYW